jgi:hypothetical protein
MNFYNMQMGNAMSDIRKSGQGLQTAMSGAGKMGGSSLGSFLGDKFAAQGTATLPSPNRESIAAGMDTGPFTLDLTRQKVQPSIAAGMDTGPFDLKRTTTPTFNLGVDMNLGGLGAALSAGGQVPGRANVDADSPQNDTVPALLSPGEVVIPREALDSVDTAHAFLDKILARKQVRGYGDVLAAQRAVYGKGRYYNDKGGKDPEPMCGGGCAK